MAGTRPGLRRLCERPSTRIVPGPAAVSGRTRKTGRGVMLMQLLKKGIGAEAYARSTARSADTVERLAEFAEPLLVPFVTKLVQ